MSLYNLMNPGPLAQRAIAVTTGPGPRGGAPVHNLMTFSDFAAKACQLWKLLKLNLFFATILQSHLTATFPDFALCSHKLPTMFGSTATVVGRYRF